MDQHNPEIKKPIIPWGWLRALIFILIAGFGYAITPSLVSPVAIGILGLKKGEHMLSEGTPNPAVFAICFAGVIIFLILIVWLFRKFLDRGKFSDIGLSLPKNKLHIVYGFILGAFLIALGFTILKLTGFLEINSTKGDTGLLLSYLALFLLQGSSEEIILRSYFLFSLRQSMNKYLAVVIVSLLFTSIHMFNPSFTWIAGVNIFLAGVLFGLYYVQWNNLWFSMALHASWNFFQGPVFGFEVSGHGIIPWIDQSVSGHELITGGKFGLEGSLIATAMITITILLMLTIFKPKRNVTA